MSWNVERVTFESTARDITFYQFESKEKEVTATCSQGHRFTFGVSCLGSANSRPSCPECLEQTKRMQIEQFLRNLPAGVKPLTTVNQLLKFGTKLELTCMRGHSWKDVLFGSHTCAKCAKMMSDDPMTDIQLKLEKKFGKQYKVESVEDGVVKTRCVSCKQCYEGSEKEVLAKTRCGNCKGTILEQRIAHILPEIVGDFGLGGEEITTQYRFSPEERARLANGAELEGKRFDFKVGKFIIEADGEQHVKETDRFGPLSKIQKADQVKQDAALKLGYKIIRIHYVTNRDAIKDYLVTAFIELTKPHSPDT